VTFNLVSLLYADKITLEGEASAKGTTVESKVQEHIRSLAQQNEQNANYTTFDATAAPRGRSSIKALDAKPLDHKLCLTFTVNADTCSRTHH